MPDDTSGARHRARRNGGAYEACCRCFQRPHPWSLQPRSRRWRTGANPRHPHACESAVHTLERRRLYPPHTRRRLFRSHGGRQTYRLTKVHPLNDAELHRWYSANYSLGDKRAGATTQVMESLKDQIAVVTGASSGMGKAIALSLAGQGAEVCLVARRRELLEDVAKQIHALGSRGHACQSDLTKEEDIRGLGERFQKEFDHLNILVLCGGAIFHGALEKASFAEFDL